MTYKNKTDFIRNHNVRKLGIVEYCLELERQGLNEQWENILPRQTNKLWKLRCGYGVGILNLKPVVLKSNIIGS